MFMEQQTTPGQTESILQLIEKVSSNPKDACFGKNKVELYQNLTKETISELKKLKYKVETNDQPVNGIHHTITWK